MPEPKATRRSPWMWVPSLYLAEGLPYVVVMTVAVIMYKGLGISNQDITLYTSLLYLPWVLKPLWSPVVDLFRTRRSWIWGMQLVIGAGFAGVALTIPTAHFFQYSLAFLWLLAFSSATQDIAIDGFYMLGTTESEQAFFSGIRNTSYRIAMICGQGLLVMLAGALQKRTGNVPLAWTTAFVVLAVLFLVFSVYHKFLLPYPVADRPKVSDARGRGDLDVATMDETHGMVVLTPHPGPLPVEGRGRNGSGPFPDQTDVRSPSSKWLEEFLRTFALFFQKPGIGRLLCFLLFYRFAEAQLVKMAAPFLLDDRNAGGLGLTTVQVGFVYGTVGVIALMCGGLLGGFLVARSGLKYWLWWMVLAIHLPDAVFVYLSYAQPDSFLTINACIAVEQFGYGFGFSAYMLYMIYIARGEHQTAHYAICTGFMALGMMMPGMASGWLQKHLGYPHFFTWVLLATIPGFLAAAFIPLDAEFGRKGQGRR